MTLLTNYTAVLIIKTYVFNLTTKEIDSFKKRLFLSTIRVLILSITYRIFYIVLCDIITDA